MTFRNPYWLGLFLLCLSMLSADGCVRVNIETGKRGIAVPEAPPFEQQTELIHRIMISRFEDSTNNTGNDVNITPDEVKRIFLLATHIAQCGEDTKYNPVCSGFQDLQDDFEDDFACKIVLKPDPQIHTFNFEHVQGPDHHELDCDGDGVICSYFDLDKVWNIYPPEGIKLVSNVRFCEGKLGPWSGCAQKSGRSMAVERPEDNNEEYEAVLWLHEFGHTKDLCHTDDPYCGLNHDGEHGVMASSIWEKSTNLNGPECFRLREGRN